MKGRKFIVGWLLLALAACSGNDGRIKGDAVSSPKSSLAPLRAGDTVQIFTLPTPVQVPGLLFDHHLSYRKELLLPNDNRFRPFYQNSILLGMRLIDLSYAAVFRDKQQSLDIFKHTRLMLSDLGISGPVDPAEVKEFEASIEHPETQARLILSYYRRGHEYFKEQNREGVGLLVIAGCFLEGMYYTLELAREHDHRFFLTLLKQQLVFAKNFNELAGRFTFPGDVQPIVDEIKAIEHGLEQMALPSSQVFKVHGVAFTPADQAALQDLQQRVYTLRNKVAQ